MLLKASLALYTPASHNIPAHLQVGTKSGRCCGMLSGGDPQLDATHMDFYSILGCPCDAEPQQIKTSHKTLALRHHPDRGGSLEEFHPISSAYEVLSVDWRRACYDDYLGTLSPEQQSAEPFIDSRFDREARGQDILYRAQVRRNLSTQQAQVPVIEAPPTHTPRGCTQFPVDCSEELKAALRAPGHDGKFCSTNKRQIALLWNSALDAELAVARDHHHRELDEATADHQQRLSQTEERVQQALEHHQQQLGAARCEYQRDLDGEIVRHREELNETVRMKEEHMKRLVDQDGTQKQQFLQLINKLHDGNGFFSNEISSSAKQELTSSIRRGCVSDLPPDMLKPAQQIKLLAANQAFGSK